MNTEYYPDFSWDINGSPADPVSCFCNRKKENKGERGGRKEGAEGRKEGGRKKGCLCTGQEKIVTRNIAESGELDNIFF